MKSLITRFAKSESGATAIEYALLAALISVGIIVSATTLGQEIAATFDEIVAQL